MSTSIKVNCSKFLFLILIVFTATIGRAQEKASSEQYLLGTEEKLEMKVHVWGEVIKPGEYRVPYDTNVLELISIAGGPTVYANISKIRLTRESESLYLTEEGLKSIVSQAREGKITEAQLEKTLNKQFANRVIEYNLNDYLKDKKFVTTPPVLRPGDVVYVPQNNWHRWRELVRVAHEVAIIASVYVWYLRANR